MRKLSLLESEVTQGPHFEIYNFEVFESMEAGKTYVIVSAANMSVALDAENGSIQNGSVLQLWDRNGSKAQKFTWKSLDGSYMLESEGSTFTLDVRRRMEPETAGKCRSTPRTGQERSSGGSGITPMDLFDY